MGEIKVQGLLYKLSPFGIVLIIILRLLLIAFPWKSLLTVDIIEPYPHTRIQRRSVKNNKKINSVFIADEIFPFREKWRL